MAHKGHLFFFLFLDVLVWAQDYSTGQPSCRKPISTADDSAQRFSSREVFVNEWGKPQILDIGEHRERTLAVISNTEEYMKKIMDVNSSYNIIRDDCRNKKPLCSHLAAGGLCDDTDERDYMLEHCSPACHACDGLKDIREDEDSLQDDEEDSYDEEEESEDEVSEDEDSEDEDESRDEDEAEESIDDDDETIYDEWDLEEFLKGEIVSTPWGVPQNLGTDDPEKVRSVLEGTQVYMVEEVYLGKAYTNVYDICENNFSECSLWVAAGHCEDNRKPFMQFNCPAACQSCEMVDYKHRCPETKFKPFAWTKSGQINAMFERITTDLYWQTYGPVSIISRPNATNDNPWVVTLDNFVSEEECKKFIEFGIDEEFERSKDIGGLNEDGTVKSKKSTGRTSQNAWCPDECNEDPITGPVHRRIEKLVGADYNHSEYIQLLSYEEGQFYENHHDFIAMEEERPYGPRVLTVYLYLNDVEKGGGTRFTDLGVTIMPKRGRAVIWPSVLDEEPLERDDRTHHEALAVEAGRKYGANAWIHQGDFKTAYTEFCT